MYRELTPREKEGRRELRKAICEMAFRVFKNGETIEEALGYDLIEESDSRMLIDASLNGTGTHFKFRISVREVTDA